MKPSEPWINRRTIRLAMLAAFAASGGLLATDMAQVALRGPGDLAAMLESGLDVVYVSPGNMADVVIYDDEDRRRLNDLGVRWQVSQANLEAFFAARLRPRRDDMGGYPTLDEIVTFLNDLHENYPDIVGEPFAIGQSVEERDILAVKISDNPDEDEDEPEVLITSLIHAREAITPMVLMETMETLTGGYGDDELITELVDEREIWFIPCHNPDGYYFNERTNPDGGGMWRKNRRRNEDGTVGVDLNRNFGEHWGFDNIGSSPRGRDATFRGEGPFSEPETAAARDFVNDRNFVLSIYFHSYSNLCLYPIGWAHIHAEDRGLFAALSAHLTSHNGYISGTGWETLYLTNGDSDDWLYSDDGHEPILAMTIEVGTQQDNFWPPANRIEPLIAENVPLCLKAIETAGHPRRTMPPPAPPAAEVRTLRGGGRVLEWEAPEDEHNPPVAFDVKLVRYGDDEIDAIEPNDGDWLRYNAEISNTNYHSEPVGLSLDIRAGTATATLAEPVVVPDTVWAWVRYRLSRENNFALEVSHDDIHWSAVRGLGTEDIRDEGFSHGPGYRGNQTEWRRVWFALDDWANQRVRLRFRYYRFSSNGLGDYCFIDDIGPLPREEWGMIVAEGLQGTRWVTEEDLDQSIRFLIRSVDAEDQASFWSRPAAAGREEPGYQRPMPAGWSLVSLPVALDMPDLEELFAGWIEEEILTLVKNEAGRFFSPRFQFNQIGAWSATEGYWIKVERADTLLALGEFLSDDTPIPLELGWNCVPYFPSEPMAPEEAFAGVGDNLLFARDMFGRFWAPEREFNNMGALERGFGYFLRLAAADTLIYPAGGRAVQWAQMTQDAPFAPLSPVCHNLLIEFDAGLDGGEIAAVDANGMVVGLSRVKAGERRIGLAVWGGADNGAAGLGEGEPFTVVHRDPFGRARVLNLKLIDGDARFTENGFSVFTTLADNLPSQTMIIDASPNPFNEQTTLSINSPLAGDLSVVIFDLRGREVHRFHKAKQAAGVGRFAWDAAGRAAGVYLARAEISSPGETKRAVKKLLLVR